MLSNSFAEALVKQEQYVKALPLAERSLAIQEKALPPGASNLADTCDLLNQIHRELGNEDEATAYAEQADAIRKEMEKAP